MHENGMVGVMPIQVFERRYQLALDLIEYRRIANGGELTSGQRDGAEPQCGQFHSLDGQLKVAQLVADLSRLAMRLLLLSNLYSKVSTV